MEFFKKRSTSSSKILPSCPCSSHIFHSSVISYSLPALAKNYYLKYEESTKTILKVPSSTRGAILVNNPYNRPVMVSYDKSSQQFCFFSGC
uniref:Uncharacterized protein n=1 Tax=viral metagenome TaxID=1070528 RepID=A0A6C0D2J4_9ZZZZ